MTEAKGVIATNVVRPGAQLPELQYAISKTVVATQTTDRQTAIRREKEML